MPCSSGRARWRSASLEWRRVEQAAVRPQPIQPTRQLDWALRADVAIEELGVIADALDDVVGPALRQPERAAGVIGDAEQAPHFGMAALQNRVQVRRRHSQLLGEDQGVHGPSEDSKEDGIVAADHLRQRLLRDLLVEDDELVRLW